MLIVGLLLDFGLTSLSDAARGRCSIVVVPVRGRALCVGALTPERADATLRSVATELGIEPEIARTLVHRTIVGAAALGLSGYGGYRGQEFDGGGRAMFPIPSLLIGAGVGANNTMSSAFEAMGLSLPYSSTMAAEDPEKADSAARSAEVLVQAIEADIRREGREDRLGTVEVSFEKLDGFI